MIDKKIENFKDLWDMVKKRNNEYLLKQHREKNQFLRALTAQILWLFLFYSIGLKLVPIGNFITANAVLFIFFSLISFSWKVIINKLPSWVPNIITGEFFYDFEIRFLNLWIAMLFLINIILIFLSLPTDFYKKRLLKLKG